jgi:hypothetical protein
LASNALPVLSTLRVEVTPRGGSSKTGLLVTLRKVGSSLSTPLVELRLLKSVYNIESRCFHLDLHSGHIRILLRLHLAPVREERPDWSGDEDRAAPVHPLIFGRHHSHHLALVLFLPGTRLGNLNLSGFNVPQDAERDGLYLPCTFVELAGGALDKVRSTPLRGF